MMPRVAQSLCEGEGAGWGTISGRRLRVLVLADPERSLEASHVVRCLERRHEAHPIAGSGWRAWLWAARTARTVTPHLIHAVGVSGAARAARAIALGVSVPSVLSLSVKDVEVGASRRWLTAAQAAGALIADGGETADRLRDAGLKRSIYVIETPPSIEFDVQFLHALEVVYGRLVAGIAEETHDGPTHAAKHARPEPDPPVVRIGALSGKVGPRGDT